jgi:hypothetical protein
MAELMIVYPEVGLKCGSVQGDTLTHS